MARNRWSLSTGSVALVAAVPKTVLQFQSPTAATLSVVQEVMVSFDGTSNTATPATVQVLRKTAAATVTGVARVKTRDTATPLAADTAATGQDASAEGTDGAVLVTWFVHPQGGVLYQVPLDGEIEVPGSGILAVKVTAPAAVNCRAVMRGED